MTNVCVGGTFDNFHYAHKVLLKKCVQVCGSKGFLYIGIASDRFAKKKKTKLQSFAHRLKQVENYLKNELNFHRYEISALHNKIGSASSSSAFDAIVVSDETYSTAQRINKLRTQKGLKKLTIINIGTVLAADFQPISATRIRNGEINDLGRLKKTLKIAVGSVNNVKLNAVKTIFSKIYGSAKIQVRGVRVPSLPYQPFEQDTVKYAIKRAKIAIKTLDADLGIGIEAGIFRKMKKYFDVQYCAITDRSGRTTIGHGSGFIYPSEIVEIIKAGKSVGDAFAEVYGIKNIGRKEGAIGFLSKGLLNRKELTEQAVLMAFIPRLQWIRHTL